MSVDGQGRKLGPLDWVREGTWVRMQGYGVAQVVRYHKGRYRVRWAPAEDGSRAERNVFAHEIEPAIPLDLQTPQQQPLMGQGRKLGPLDGVQEGTWVRMQGYGVAQVVRYHKGRYRVRWAPAEDGSRAERNLYAHEIELSVPRPGAMPEPEPAPPHEDGPPISEHLPGAELSARRAEVDFAGAGLGSGGFADVRQGTYCFPGQADALPVAFKIFRGAQALMSAGTRQQMIRELQVGQQLRHPNLIRLFGLVLLPERGPALLMELAAGGSLRDALSNRIGHPELKWQHRLSWLRDVAAGMSELHGLLPRAVIHRDLKAANVLLSSPDLASATAKVADFGVATVMETVRATLSGGGGGMAGTLAWKAPETFDDRYSEHSDVFAFAVLCFEVLTRQIPWDGVGQPAIIERLRSRFEYDESLFTDFGVSREQQQVRWEQRHPLQERRPDLALAEPGCPEQLLAFVERCWADDPDQRPRFTGCAEQLETIRPALTFGTSHFKAAHEMDVEPVTLATDAFHAVTNFLQHYCRVYGLTSDSDKALLKHFMVSLQRQTGQHDNVDTMGLVGPTAELLLLLKLCLG